MQIAMDAMRLSMSSAKWLMRSTLRVPLGAVYNDASRIASNVGVRSL